MYAKVLTLDSCKQYYRSCSRTLVIRTTPDAPNIEKQCLACIYVFSYTFFIYTTRAESGSIDVKLCGEGE